MVDAVSSILDDINLQYPNYDLDFFSNSRDFTGISIVDTSNIPEDYSNIEFEFKPFSKNSIVYDIKGFFDKTLNSAS